jgi:hypothetical protein
MSNYGSAISVGAVYDRVTKLTKAKFGKPMNPHLLLNCAATSTAIEDPNHIGITTSVLGHTSLRARPLASLLRWVPVRAGRRGFRRDPLATPDRSKAGVGPAPDIDRRSSQAHRQPAVGLSYPAAWAVAKVFCGICDRGCADFGKDYLGCRAAKHGGYRNKARVRRQYLEAQVLDVMGCQLLRDDLLNEFMDAFIGEWERTAAEIRAAAAGRKRERSAIQRRISNLVEAIGDGRASPSILAKLVELEAQLQQPRTDAVVPTVGSISTAQQIAGAYPRRIAGLRNLLPDCSDPEALEVARAMIDKVLSGRLRSKANHPG